MAKTDNRFYWWEVTSAALFQPHCDNKDNLMYPSVKIL